MPTKLFLERIHVRSIAILEFVCGGGFASQAIDAIPRGLLAEGRSMLEALANDWSQLADCRVHIAWDTRLGAWPIPNVAVHPVDVSGSLIDVWSAIASCVETCLVIAPEIDGQLIKLTQALRQNCRVELLNVDEEYALAAGDKWRTAHWFEQANITHPPTRLLSEVLYQTAGLPVSESGFWVVKQRDGAGCEGIFRLAANDGGCELNHLPGEVREHADQYVVQPWLSGCTGSIAVLVSPNACCVFPPMTQRIDFRARLLNSATGGERLVYSGGEGPWFPVPTKVIETFAKSVIRALPGQPMGWLGIDFLVASDRPDACSLVAIEINPRMTTSYLGIRRAIAQNLASIWLDMVLDRAVDYSILEQCISFSPFGNALAIELN